MHWVTVFVDVLNYYTPQTITSAFLAETRWLLELTRVHSSNGISTSSTVLTQLMVVSRRQNRPRNIGNNRPRLCTVTNYVKIGHTVAEILQFFCDFQDGVRRHLGFLKIRNFNGRGEDVSTCQISL